MVRRSDKILMRSVTCAVFAVPRALQLALHSRTPSLFSLLSHTPHLPPMKFHPRLFNAAITGTAIALAMGVTGQNRERDKRGRDRARLSFHSPEAHSRASVLCPQCASVCFLCIEPVVPCSLFPPSPASMPCPFARWTARSRRFLTPSLEEGCTLECA